MCLHSTRGFASAPWALICNAFGVKTVALRQAEHLLQTLPHRGIKGHSVNDSGSVRWPSEDGGSCGSKWFCSWLRLKNRLEMPHFRRKGLAVTRASAIGYTNSGDWI